MDFVLKGEEYEEERRRRIAQNMQILAQLGLDKPVLLSTKRAKSHRKVKREDREPTRRNLRSNDKLKDAFVPLSDEDTNDGSDDESLKPKKRKVPLGKRKSNLGRRIQGGRIYDSELGTTCHQCRQKTIEDKVTCTNILPDGTLCKVKFDDRCLSGRYGETLEDARKTGEWSCPKCRDVCNCSFCRRKKGLPPTGILKNIAQRKGFKSVMHFLGDQPNPINGTAKIQAIIEDRRRVKKTMVENKFVAQVKLEPTETEIKDELEPNFKFELAPTTYFSSPSEIELKVENELEWPDVNTKVEEPTDIKRVGTRPTQPTPLKRCKRRKVEKIEDEIDWSKFEDGVCVFIKTE